MTTEIPHLILSRKDEITQDFIKLADKYINDLLQNRIHRRFSAKDFGALLFIHPRHLTNTIKLTTGKSPCDMVEERLVEAAKNLLLHTRQSVTDIGYQLAYNDAANFIRFFKSMTGITPLQYRKSHQ